MAKLDELSFIFCKVVFSITYKEVLWCLACCAASPAEMGGGRIHLDCRAGLSLSFWASAGLLALMNLCVMWENLSQEQSPWENTYMLLGASFWTWGYKAVASTQHLLPWLSWRGIAILVWVQASHSTQDWRGKMSSGKNISLGLSRWSSVPCLATGSLCDLG